MQFSPRQTNSCHERCPAPHTCWNFLPKPIDMKKKTEKIALLALLLTLPSALHADDILGRVVDASTGEALPGATVVISERTGTLSDDDGCFALRHLKQGRYTLTVRYLGYTTLTLHDVRPRVEGDTTRMVISLQPDDQMLGEARVVETKRRNTANAMITAARESDVIVNNISAQEIKRAQDGNAGEVIRRIPGVSLIEDKFVMVRGLSQRYNNVWINGSAVPSSEADSRAFSFDVIPASQIDHLSIIKTPSSIYPADYCGGFIEVTTKDIPSDNGFSVSLGGNVNTSTHFSSFLSGASCPTDFLGFDNGRRALPGGISAKLPTLPGTSGATGLQEAGFDNDWRVRAVKPVSDLRLQAEWHRRMAFESGKLGLTATLNYARDFRAYEGMTNNLFGAYDLANDKRNYLRRSIDNQYNRNIRLGGLFNMAFLGSDGRHRLEFKNMVNQLGLSRYTQRTGVNAQSDNEDGAEYLYQSRLTYNGQFGGRHEHASGRGHTQWTAGYSYANRLLPDRRRYTVDDALNRGTMMLTAGNEISREFTRLDEHILSCNVNDTEKFSLGRHTLTLETGAYAEHRRRTYTTRNFIYNWPLTDKGLLPVDFRTMDVPTLLSSSQYFGADGLHLLEQQQMRNNYGGRNWQGAAFAVATLPIDRWTLYAGLRYEYNRMTLITNTRDYEPSPMERRYDTSNLFPTFNVTWRLDARQQFRVSYGRTANRPEFREVSPTVFYDFSLASSVQGNVDLKTCYIDNIDFRYEIYPSSGEQITLAAFYKHFDSPIEWTYTVAGGTSLVYSYENALKADSYGLELDIRKSLDFIGLPHFSLSFNGAYIRSRVQFAEGSRFKNRPMQGQSPYLINTGIFYQHPKWQFTAAVLYNRIGKRIIGVGRSEGSTGNDDNARVPDSYEMPRDVLDIALSKQWGEIFELKFGIRDLLAQNVTYRQFDTVTLHGGTTREVRQTTRQYKPGRNISLTAVVKF